MRYKWTLILFVISAAISASLYYQYGKIADWYAGLCVILIIWAFFGEMKDG